MAEQELAIVPTSGDVETYIVDDEGMHGTADSGGSSGDNGTNPIVTFPDDRVGPTAEEPERRFYMHEPQFHWHVVMPTSVDEGARRAVEHIAQDCFRFGQQTEGREHMLLSRNSAAQN